MKNQRSIDAKKIALTKRILTINDPKKLDAIGDAIDSDGYMSFSTAELAQLEAIRNDMANGSDPGVPWKTLKKELLAGKRG